MRLLVALLGLAAVACGSDPETSSAAATTTAGSGGASVTSASTASATSVTTGGAGGAPVGDSDGDGIDDAAEEAMARDYFPFLSIHPDDQCPLHGVLYRLSPHPSDATKIHILYDVLYERDCGLNGHVGDNEAMGVFVDPQQPAPRGILAVRTISHQNTICEKQTTCGTLPNCEACVTAMRNNAMYPVAFSSKDKHGGYTRENSCDTSVLCDAGGCALNTVAPDSLFVNAGEPEAHLVDNLTTQGFITQANGWTEQELFDLDPWGTTDFGGAGNVAEDLIDAAFVIDPSGC
ncbi:MAG TPA: hypothetical protein VFB62_05825 [Polyangiaceae bacterium]|nr:hypothetical protein [Polyangiaceae bacterium]